MRITAIALLAGIAASQPAAAVNWNFLEYGPASRFTAEDWALLRQHGRAALEEAGDGEVREWHNPASGAGGTITPLNTFERDGSTCRRTEISNQAEDASGMTRFDFCKQADGTWKVVSGRPAAATP